MIKRVVSRIGPVDKDKIWAEKSYSETIPKFVKTSCVV